MRMGRISAWLWRFLSLDQFEFHELRLTQDVLAGVKELARMTYPKEFVILLDGRVAHGVLTIDGLLFQSYRASRSSAHFDIRIPPAYRFLGTIHSHPVRSNQPSEADLALFAKYGLVHGIICYPYDRGDLAFYDKAGHPIHWRLSGPDASHRRG